MRLTPYILRTLCDLRMMDDVVECLDKTQKTVNEMDFGRVANGEVGEHNLPTTVHENNGTAQSLVLRIQTIFQYFF